MKSLKKQGKMNCTFSPCVNTGVICADFYIGIVGHKDKTDDGIYRKRQYEVDFIANLAGKRYYIQSALSLLDERKLEQELRSLSMIRDSFGKIVITRDRIKPRHTENGILIINLFDFLLKADALEM